MKRSVFILFFSVFSFLVKAQSSSDSCSLQISLLTVGPGGDLDALFGHTAIRVQDQHRGMDIVYNYGTFDDSDPLFYLKFMRGIMLYSLSATTFGEFRQEYVMEHRFIKSQMLNLNCSEKNQLYEALRKNTLDENRFYQYHFHTDNCTTRAARIIEDNTAATLVYKNTLHTNSTGSLQGMSYRMMINEYLEKQNAYWSEFGINILLGMNLDVYPTNTEAIHFLPDYLYEGMDSAHAGNKSMVVERETLLSFPEIKQGISVFTPMTAFIILLALSVVLYFLKYQRALLIFDISFFTLLGLIGILISFMWLGRVDDVCSKNINILWALPTHIVAVFFIRKKGSWIKYYFLITCLIAALLFAGFPFWPQEMSLAVLPLLVIIMFRSYSLFQKRNHEEKNSIQRGVARV